MRSGLRDSQYLFPVLLQWWGVNTLLDLMRVLLLPALLRQHVCRPSFLRSLDFSSYPHLHGFVVYLIYKGELPYLGILIYCRKDL